MPDKKTTDQQAAAKRFAQVWKDRGYEKGDSQTFWLSLLHDVYGVEHPGSSSRLRSRCTSTTPASSTGPSPPPTS